MSKCKTGWNPYGDTVGMCMAGICSSSRYECCAACHEDCNIRCGYAADHTKNEKEITQMSKIPDNILSILGECRVEGNTLFLPEGQLDRPVYQAVNKVLENIGGKWNRKAQGHVFADGDPADLLDAVLLTGETVDLKKQFQFFPTPRPVAEKMCELAELDDTCIVLEPECGKGDLADVIYEVGVKELVGLELNQDMEKYLSGKPYATLTGIDFLEFVKDDPSITKPWTRIVMNPPFSRQQDIDHILTAYNILAPGGILVSIVSESPFFRQNKKSADFRELLDKHEAEIIPLDEGAFKESGTMVRTRIIKLRKEWQSIPNPAPEVKHEPAKKDTQGTTGNEILMIPTAMLFPHPDNPRKDVGDVTELAESIKATGILQNLTVVPRLDEDTKWDGEAYTVIIGHRRLAAAKKAGLGELPCIVREMSLQEQVKTMLLENMQRTDLTVYEQAQGFQMMLDMGETVESIAKGSGFSQSTVRCRVKLLELDADKFKKSEARGATLQDYMELDKVEDPEVKNKLLDAIGTANFRNELKSAIEKEENKKLIAGWTRDAEAFAERVDKCDYSTMEYVTGYSIWRKSENVVKPEDADDVPYYFTADERNVTIYKKKQPHEETEEERQRKAAQEALAKKESELKEITERHFSLRQDFIMEFGQSKKYLPQIIAFAVSDIVGTGEWGRDDIDAEILAQLLDLDIDLENSEYEDLREATAKVAAERPEYTLLACAYAGEDNDENKYWTRQWSRESNTQVICYEANDALDALYAFLTSIGYEMSDEEKAMQNGTHPLLNQG